jgi:SAM-dependent methyltransferase
MGSHALLKVVSMSEFQRRSVWGSGAAYEPYVGRWSRLVARAFLAWLALPPSARWLDVGCGTGALSETILAQTSPAAVHGIDPSEGYLALAREQVRDPRVHFGVGDVRQLSGASAAYDVVVSGLVLNFIPDLSAGMAEMVRVTRPGGVVAAYVWDYAGKMELMRYFWDAAVTLKPEARERDEGRRFPICQPEALRHLFRDAGLHAIDLRAIEVPTHFRDFEDYWAPFLGGQFPAPEYAMSLREEDRAALREQIRVTLPFADDGTIRLIARAWAVRGEKTAS